MVEVVVGDQQLLVVVFDQICCMVGCMVMGSFGGDVGNDFIVIGDLVGIVDQWCDMGGIGVIGICCLIVVFGFWYDQLGIGKVGCVVLCQFVDVIVMYMGQYDMGDIFGCDVCQCY